MNKMEVYIINQNEVSGVKTYNIWSPNYMRQCRSERMKRLYSDSEWVTKWKKTLKVTGVRDRRKNLVQPNESWYEVTEKEMKRCGMPFRKSKGEYLKWFEIFGYKSETIEVKGKRKSGHLFVKKRLIVYKTDSAIEEAKKYFG